MSLRHVWAVTRKEFHHIVRDKSTLILVLITPTLVLLLMAYALTVDLKNIPIAILDLTAARHPRLLSADHGRARSEFIFLYATNHGRDQCHVGARPGQGSGDHRTRVRQRISRQ